MKTLTYYRRAGREIVVGNDYYLGELWDGNGDLESIFDEKRKKGYVCVDVNEDDLPVLVSFMYNALNTVELLSTIVTVTDVF